MASQSDREITSLRCIWLDPIWMYYLEVVFIALTRPTRNTSLNLTDIDQVPTKLPNFHVAGLAPLSTDR
jgi:hypothetical protein